jgi:outer membrane protein assembly factor BamB
MKIAYPIFVICFLVACFCNSNKSFAQGVLYFDLELHDIKHQPLSFTDVWLIEKNTGDSISGKTNGTGTVSFEINTGRNWSLNFKEIREHTILTVPVSGGSKKGLSVTYVPDERNLLKKIRNRSGILFKDTTQFVSVSKMPEGNNGILRLRYFTKIDAACRNLHVTLVNIDEGTKVHSSTDNVGEVRFWVKMGQSYEIDVDGNEAHDYVEIPEGKAMLIRMDKHYEPTVINEKNENDTIRQNLSGIFGPTSSRAYISIVLKNFDREFLPNEDVYLDALESETVYHTKTDKYGRASFLVPKEYRYELSFKYERGVKLIEHNNTQGMVSTTGEFFYRGSKQIEDFFKKSKRTKEGFLTEFMTVEVTPDIINYNYLEKTEHGYSMNFESETPVNTPLIINNDIIVNAGFYAPQLYCFNALTGKFKWGLKLAETGISSAVCEDSILFVNTYSCTIYAILASTGELLWSKWLGPSIYSTPAVSNGKVYTVYPNDLNTFSDASGNFVAVCFDIRNGEIIWQNWIDSDVISTPVISGENVYLSSYTGAIYSFDKNTGSLNGKSEINALSPPTIVGGKIFFPAKSVKSGYAEIISLNSTTLAREKSFVSNAYKPKCPTIRQSSASQKISYNGEQIIHYKTNLFNISGSKLYSINSKNGSINWSFSIAQPNSEKDFVSSMPIVIADKVMIATNDGFIKIIDYKTGKLINQFDVKNQLWNQPAVHDGVIYAGTTNGKLITLNTKDKSLTGWNMWGANANHNCSID